MSEFTECLPRPMVSQMAYENHMANLTPIDVIDLNDLHMSMFGHLTYTIFTDPYVARGITEAAHSRIEWHVVEYDRTKSRTMFELFALCAGHYLSMQPAIIEHFQLVDEIAFTVKGHPRSEKCKVTVQQALEMAKASIRESIEKKLTAHRAAVVDLQNTLFQISDVQF